MKINKIEKMSDDKYKIYLDNDILIIYEDTIIKNNLLYKKEIDDNLYNKLLEDNKFYDIYNKTVKFILKHRRSEKEVYEYLLKKDLTDDNIKSIISKLKDINLINDLEYCKAYINDKVYLGSNGINKIRIDLLNQNIPINVIEEQLSNIDISILNSKLEKMILKKIKYNKKYSKSLLRNKILNEMILLGYSKEDVLNIIDNNINNTDDNILEKEFNKCYNTLKSKRKYSCEELNNKVRQKLISKGFNLSEINELIKKNEEI